MNLVPFCSRAPKRRRTALFWGLTFLCFACVTGCRSPRPAALGNGPQGPPLVVGMECAFAPYNFRTVQKGEGTHPIDGGSARAAGYDVRIAQLIAQKMDRPLIIKQIAWEGLIPALQAGGIDLIVAGMSETKERAASVAFSEAYYEAGFAILVQKGSRFDHKKSLSEYAGARFVGQKSTSYDRAIDQIPGAVHLPPLGSVPLLIHALQSGVADGLVVERPVAVALAQARSDLSATVLEGPGGFQAGPQTPTSVSIALPLGKEPLLQTINAILRELSSSQRDAWMQEAMTQAKIGGMR
ncbi:hypothetical protein ABB02_00882 [Clostridiaceae bacterium JG1575]|nr:hypothetical protein ABB02_00882 [Clostridiaceae bacterium JG1575]